MSLLITRESHCEHGRGGGGRLGRQANKIQFDKNLTTMMSSIDSSLQSMRGPQSVMLSSHSVKTEQMLSALTSQVEKIALRVEANAERLADMQAESLSGFAKLEGQARQQHDEVLQGLQTVIAANVVSFPTLMFASFFFLTFFESVSPRDALVPSREHCF
jgi:hypothetical protein